MGCENELKKIYTILVTIIFLASFTPLVLGATEDSVIITFDPDGDIDIEISHVLYDFGSAVACTWTNTTGNTFTVYNNGTVAMNTRIKSNATTDEGNMKLNESGIAPRQDEYAIYIKGLDVSTFVNSSYTVYFDTGLLPMDSKTFDICLLLGNLSANHTAQTTTIYFQGSITT